MLAVIAYDPLVSVRIGPLPISPHGVGIAVGFLLGARLMLPAARRKGISEDDAYACVTRAAIGAIIGARLAYVANHLGEYHSVVEVLQVWQGGISLLGGIFGAILLAMPEIRRRRISFWRIMDAAAPGMALGIAVGRVGDVVVADHLGKPTTFFLGYRCPPPVVETASPCLGAVVHQTALYDLLLTAVLLAVLLRLRRRPRYDGHLIVVFGAWYGVQRVVEDFLREDVRHLGLTGSQITALVTVGVCAAWLVLGRRTPGWGRWDRDGAGDGEGAADATPAEATPAEATPLEASVGADAAADPPTMAPPPGPGEEE